MGFLNPTFLLAVLVALSFHECAHAYAAYLLGDHTAKVEGRLTLNPIAHLDPLGTILFLMIGFGWGKPVPVNPYYFKHPKRDSAITALAGPLSNFLLALVAFLLLKILAGASMSGSDAWSLLSADYTGTSVAMKFLLNFLSVLLFVNLGLMSFNLLPVAPLDGSKMLQLFVPLRYELEYERIMSYGPYILLGLIVAARLLNFDLLGVWISTIMNAVLHVFSAFL